MLAACSEVFNAMFSHVDKETTFNEVIIEDVDLTALKIMLESVKTDDIKDYEGLAAKLILAADKYDMADLKTIAVNEAIRKFTVDNVCNSLRYCIHTFYFCQTLAMFFY
ncbi:hypothetical protein TCAL_09509 [Tigriopus californicus]|uniref:BTB domain-containing protein n=1 Tax=Tigriopus californicus TaxID=6832 RepID=A0A553PCN3_TIGCA|nr:hypothetical protein TCAL_09509 [Tigriopus californicus]|eukprot:TCALIF_09509-PA protein Name:"Similar to Spopl Speckle-type POZ protein-like (Mus musculus)" AED:0.43 eAED:0.43 QI:0/-1/0/1/-1/1/1/0/108